MIDTITKEELVIRIENGAPMALFDVRSKDEYDQRHIPNAIHLPLEELEKIVRYLNCNTLYVTVCGKGGGRSEEGAGIISEMGLKSASLVGGTFGWFETETE